ELLVDDLRLFAFLDSMLQLRREVANRSLVPECIQDPVPRRGHQQRRMVGGDAGEAPALVRPGERLLDCVLDQRKAIHTEGPSQSGDQAGGFAPEEGVVQVHGRLMTGRTSTSPASSRPGQPCARETASARSLASMSEKPMTMSLDSA